jgi:hypothetical protein
MENENEQVNRFLDEMREQLRSRTTTKWTAKFRGPDGKISWRTMLNRVVTTGLNVLLARTFHAVPADVNWFVGLIGAATGTVTTNGTTTLTGSGTTFTGSVGSRIVLVGQGSGGADHITTVAAVASATSLTLTAAPAGSASGVAFAIEPLAGATSAAPGFNEMTGYSEATRPAWTPNGAPASGAISNSSSPAAFSFNGTSRIFGAFLISNSTKGGTTGTLFGGNLFTEGSQPVTTGGSAEIQADPSVAAA